MDNERGGEGGREGGGEFCVLTLQTRFFIRSI